MQQQMPMQKLVRTKLKDQSTRLLKFALPGNYPFTTIDPNYGVTLYQVHELTQLTP